MSGILHVETDEDGSVCISVIGPPSPYLKVQEKPPSSSYAQVEEDTDQRAQKPAPKDEHSAKHQTSNVTAFVTLLKALFGVSLLSSPRVLGETGLVLGTVVYSWLVLACVGSCWCLLQARAKVTEVAAQAAAVEAAAAAEVQDSKRPSLESAFSSQGPPRNHAEAITYGDLGRTLLGPKPSVLINFLIVSLHICFGAGLVATSIHQVAVVLGWEEDSSQEDGSSYEVWLAGRAILAAAFFPFIAMLLQFRNIKDLFAICLAGIVVFAVGVIGTMIYSTLLADKDEDGDGSVDGDGDADGDDGGYGYTSRWNIPSDAFEWKFSGIPNFVASTLCAMEGINLALPIANQWYLIKKVRNNSSTERSPAPVVMASVACFGVITLLVAYFGYLSGLGGSSGSNYYENDEEQEEGEAERAECAFVAHCMNSVLLERIHRLSMTAALILTLPIILYPSLELLERWVEERQFQLMTGRTSSNREIGSTWNGFVSGPATESFRQKLLAEENILGKHGILPFVHRRWRLRLAHAAAVCLIAIVDRPWERVLVLFKGIGLSIACFLLPVVLFVKAHSLAAVLQQPALTAALGGLMSLGAVNVVLVILSVFTKHNFLPPEVLHDDPLGHHHHSQDSHDEHY